jgi:peptidyl-prolyl cis-trans isomerase SurA
MKSIRPLLAFLLLAATGSAEQLEGIAAVVGDEVVLISELASATQLITRRFESQRGPIPPEYRMQIRSDALQGLIDQKLIYDYARSREMAATEEEIDRAINGIAADEGVAEDQIYAAAREQGLTRTAYREELGTQITRMKVLSNVVQGRVSVTEQEVQQLFEERYGSQAAGLRVRVRHILIPWPDEATEEKRERMREIAETIRERAIESGAFASLARQYSRAPSAADGGLSTFKQGEVAPEIAEYVFGLPAGEITPVIETAHGLNIFQIVNRFDPADIQYDDVSDALNAELLERKTMPEYERWVEELRENRYVHIIDTGAR